METLPYEKLLGKKPFKHCSSVFEDFLLTTEKLRASFSSAGEQFQPILKTECLNKGGGTKAENPKKQNLH